MTRSKRKLYKRLIKEKTKLLNEIFCDIEFFKLCMGAEKTVRKIADLRDALRIEQSKKDPKKIDRTIVMDLSQKIAQNEKIKQQYEGMIKTTKDLQKYIALLEQWLYYPDIDFDDTESLEEDVK